MHTRLRRALFVPASFLIGCSITASDGRLGDTTPASALQADAARPSIDALQRGRFEEAAELAEKGLAADGDNPYPHLVRAISRYERSMRTLAREGRGIADDLDEGRLDDKAVRAVLRRAEGELGAVDEDLAAAAARSGIGLDLCLACWDLDWNGNGRIDRGDALLLQIEQDEAGEPIAEDDPRRKPTFHFDDGDVLWARAFVSFQRAGLDLLMAYDLGEIAKLAKGKRDMPERITLRLVDRGRVGDARDKILEGLNFSDGARKRYLAETDDDREWVPNPRQKSHPMPLPVDALLYQTWEGVLGDVRRLVEGDEGLALAEVAELSGERLHVPVKGYLDLGHLLAHPKDIDLDLKGLTRMDRRGDLDGMIASVLGEGYNRSMKPSPLPARLGRMKGEIDRREESFGRKLRYLFWLN
ncbi:MAG: hypothetical protein U0359_00420 [Byssovorax sp.]